MPAILSTIDAYPPFRQVDVLLLQEAGETDGVCHADRIAGRLGSDFQAHQRAVDRFYGQRRGISVIWNPRTVAWRDIDFLRLPHCSESALPMWRRYPLQMARLRERGALVLDGCLAGRSLRLYNLHLSPMGFAFQMEQMAVLLRDNDRRPAAEGVILAGDFNSLRVDRRRWQPWFARMEQAGFRNVTKDVEWTFWSRSLPLWQKLDNVLVKWDAAQHATAWSPQLPGSDHFPVFVELATEGDQGHSPAAP